MRTKSVQIYGINEENNENYSFTCYGSQIKDSWQIRHFILDIFYAEHGFVSILNQISFFID